LLVRRAKGQLCGVISIGQRNTLIFLERWSVYDEVSHTDVLYRYAEVGDVGSMAARRVFERPFQTGIGPVSVRIPKVRSKDGTPVTFRSALVPPYVRRTKMLEAALPWLYLKGISSGEMAPALKVLLGPDAKGLIGSIRTVRMTVLTAVHRTCSEGPQSALNVGMCMAQHLSLSAQTEIWYFLQKRSTLGPSRQSAINLQLQHF
jgi:hypothetical protein